MIMSNPHNGNSMTEEFFGVIGRNVDNSTSNIESTITDNESKNKTVKVTVASMAKRRWKILSKALCHCPPNECETNEKEIDSFPKLLPDDYSVSVRRFTCFNLFHRKNLNSTNRNWCTFRAIINRVEYSAIVHEIRRKLTPEDLIGFNNTGNICVWPSEESLAYYALSNLELFRHQKVLELGGGMTCLAGLFIALYGQADFVNLTDGNEVSIQNVDKILKQNFPNESPKVNCSVLKWENVDKIEDTNRYDCILSADCLFFESARSFFVQALWQCMKSSGFGLIMAPKRGETLNKFIEEARQIGFDCNVKKRYNSLVWQKHLTLMETNLYEEDIHYPVLIEVRKSTKINLK